MTVKVWAVLAAAGSGQRYNAQQPKQYSLLNGKTLLQRSLDTLFAADLFTSIVTVLAPDDNRFASLAVAKDPLILTAVGGANRAESVLNGLVALESTAESNDWVMVHDAARALLTVAEVKKLYAAVSAHPAGGILAKPVVDTVKSARDDSNPPEIEATIDRKKLWLAQTPQMVRYDLLKSSLLSLKQQGRLAEVTDEASAVELMGHAIQLVDGDPNNIKITRPEDRRIAEAILSERA